MNNQSITVESELNEDGDGFMWFYNKYGKTTHYVVYRNHQVSRVMIYDDECKEVGLLQHCENGGRSFTKKTERHTSEGLVRTTITRTK